MKKYFLLIGLFYVSITNSQVDTDAKISKIEANKTGNYKDVLHNLLQLTTKNLSDDAKTLELNSTLFTILYGADLTDISDLTIKKSSFLRNFQINAKTNFDNNFKYNGFSGGITYALINGRDKATLNLAVGGKKYAEKSELFRLIFMKIQSELATGLVEDSNELEQLNEASDAILAGNEYDSSTNPYYNKIIERFNNFDYKKELSELDSSETSKAVSNFIEKDLKDCVEYLKQIKKSEYDNIDARALWTLSIDGSANTEGKFNQASIGTIFLKGNSSSWYEFDLRSKITYADTVTTEHLPRVDFKATAGMNFKLGKDKNNKSFFEIKPYFEYNSLLKNTESVLATAKAVSAYEEKKNKFILNAEIRVRLTDNLWLPLTVKYDTEKSNFLGFLNVSYNFGD